ncbi:MAG TPA: ABC transporter permease [bacterium]|nr:ABC transporter permease [bacterium]
MTARVRIGRILRVLLKELAEARRDRNLWINVVLVPLFLYPVLGFAFFQVFLMIRGMSERELTVIAVDSRAPAAVVDSLSAAEQVQVVALPEAFRNPQGRPSAAGFRRARTAAADSAGAREIQAALLWEPGEAGAPASAAVLFDRSLQRSEDAKKRILTAVEDWERARTLERLAAVGLSETDLQVWPVDLEDTASAEERGRRILSLALPMILLLMLAQGTFYSALDTVVGERERGTWETLLTCPLSRGDALVGKFLFVVAASVVALALNLASLTLFFGFLLQLLGDGVAEAISVNVSPAAVALILLTALLTAAVIAALLMILAAPAKTYREGQATLTPAYLLILVPGLVVSFQRGAFSLEQAGIPILNSVALFKSVLRGEFPPGPIVLTLVVLALAGTAALLTASRLVGREEIWFDPTMSLRRLLTGRGGGRR